MSDQSDDTQPPDDISDRIHFAFHVHLRDHSAAVIEAVIAEAISKLTGYDYKCSISDIDFEAGTAMPRHIEMNLKIRRIGQ